MANANSLNISAGIAAGGTTGFEMCWFAPVDTAGPSAVSYTAEVQTVTITGSPTSLVLFWKGLSSGTQTGSVTTTALATALNAAWAAYLNGGTITVTGTAGTSYVITFPSILGNVTAITGTVSGGTSPTLAVAETTPGAGSSLATAVVPAGYKSAGYITSDGLTITPNETATTITPYGSQLPVRTIISAASQDFDVTFLESNQIVECVYNRLPLSSITVGADGSYQVQIGTASNTIYAGIFDSVVDGNNHLRFYCPRLQVSKRGAIPMKAGAVVQYPVTFTPLPDANGVGIYKDVQIGALAGTGAGS